MKEEANPESWQMSELVPIYKGKGDVLEYSSSQGIKLLEHGMKVAERVLERRLRQAVEIDKMQFGFRPGTGTTHAIFIDNDVVLCHTLPIFMGLGWCPIVSWDFAGAVSIFGLDAMQYLLQDSYKSDIEENTGNCGGAFVDLEKAFDRVPRKVVEWTMRKLGVEEWLVRAVMAIYKHARTRVRSYGGSVSEWFGVNVGVHQGSVLSALLFIIVMEAVTHNVREGSTMGDAIC